MARAHDLKALGLRISSCFFVPRRCGYYQATNLMPIVDKKVLSEPLAEDDPHLYLPIRAPYSNVCPHVYNDPLLNKFINMLMEGGNKYRVRHVVYKALERVKRERVKALRAKANDPSASKVPEEEQEGQIPDTNCSPLSLFHAAIANATPIISLRPIKRGGIVYQVPSPISAHHAQFKALQWLRDVSREKPKIEHLDTSLAREILDAANGTGRLVKKKFELHKQAEANRAYAHYRWS